MSFPNNSLSLGILVLSCDKYEDIWRPFFHCLERYWPDRPFPCYLVTNHQRPEFPGVSIIAVGDDRTWSDNVLKALEQVGEDYVLMFIEDLLLHAPVDATRLERILTWVATERPPYVQLVRSESPDGPHSDLVGVVLPGTLYRTSTVISVWRKDVLKGILTSGESAWDFELTGSARSDAFGVFYRSWTDCFKVTNCIIKGVWYPPALKQMRALGVPISTTPARRAMSIREFLVFQAVILRSKVFKLFPRKLRRRIRLEILKRGR